jgi:hypothetical protein
LKTRPEHFLILIGVAATLAFSVWNALLNNFAIEQAAFTGREIGMLQSLREVPGFLAFTTVFLAGAVMAAVSLLLSRMVPRSPSEGNEVRPPLRSLRYRFT